MNKKPQKRGVGRPQEFSHPVKLTVIVDQAQMRLLDKWAAAKGVRRSDAARVAIDKLTRAKKARIT